MLANGELRICPPPLERVERLSASGHLIGDAIQLAVCQHGKFLASLDLGGLCAFSPLPLDKPKSVKKEHSQGAKARCGPSSHHKYGRQCAR